MIYLDTSVALAQLLAEDRRPDPALFRERLVASRLLAYEVWNRVNARGLTGSHGDVVRELLGRVALVELAPSVLERALEPFPSQVRTLDALHLATLEYLRKERLRITLATYDVRMLAAASALGIATATL